MDVVTLSPFRVGSILWQPRAGAFRLTVVTKATFDVLPGESRLADSQEDLNEDDNHWNDDPARSLHSPSDMAPFKMRADVLVVGHAFAPRGEAVLSLVARALVAEMDKAIEVVGARGFKDGVLEEPAPFMRMPLSYERAAGGPESLNPVGVPADAAPDANGVIPVASIVTPGSTPGRPGSFVEPAGFGPIAPSWPLRRAQLGRHAGAWERTAWNRAPLPEDIELGYFNAAPRDQQIEAIRDNERLVLENLHPDHPQLVTRLPGLHPRAFLERPGRGPEDVSMRGDTLWIDTDRGICTLTWRGQIALESPHDVGRVLVAMEDSRQRLTFAEVERLAKRAPPKATKPVVVPVELAAAAPESRPVELPVPSAPVEPIDRAQTKLGLGGPFDDAAAAKAKGPAARFMATPVPQMAPGGGSLSGRPRRPSAAPPPLSIGDSPNAASIRADIGPPPRVPRLVDEPSHPTMDMTHAGLPNPAALASALPFAPPKPGAGIDPSLFSNAHPQPRVRMRPVDDATVTEEPAGFSSGMPAWLAAQNPPPSTALPRTELAPPAPPTPPLVSPPVIAAEVDGRAAHGEAKPKRPRSNTLASRASELADAVVAATAAPQPPPPPRLQSDRPPPRLQSERPPPPPTASVRPSPLATPAGRFVELVHVDPIAATRLRYAPGFAALLEGVAPSGEDEPTSDSGALERRHVYAVISRGTPGDPSSVPEVLARGVGSDGSFSAPVLLLAGELELAFDEVESLRAAVAALAPLLPTDPAGVAAERGLVDAVAAADAWLARNTGATSSVAEALASRIADAMARGSRVVPNGYLDAHVERSCLERRAYLTRLVLGDRWIRAALSSPGGAPVPAYIPLAAAPRLPLFRRFPVRVVVEIHPRQDQFERHPACVRVLALGRRVDLGA